MLWQGGNEATATTTSKHRIVLFLIQALSLWWLSKAIVTMTYRYDVSATANSKSYKRFDTKALSVLHEFQAHERSASATTETTNSGITRNGRRNIVFDVIRHSTSRHVSPVRRIVQERARTVMRILIRTPTASSLIIAGLHSSMAMAVSMRIRRVERTRQ